jgi:hypothetical protein
MKTTDNSSAPAGPFRGPWLALLALVSTGIVTADDVRGGILPPERLTTWNPGLMSVGGIPQRTTVFTNIGASAYGDGTQDASAGIQAALETCPAGQVVQLSAGTFTVNNLLLIHSGITLRGAGPGVTVLQKTNGARPRISPTQPVDPGTYNPDPQPLVIIGASRWPGPDTTTSQNLTADGINGARSITVQKASAFTAGQFVLLDELSGAHWQPTPIGFPDHAKVWAGDRVAWNMHWPLQQYQDDCDNADATGPYDTDAEGHVIRPPAAMSWFCRPDRPTCEIKEISSVNGNTITFTTPLHIGYRTNHTAQLLAYSDYSGSLSDRASAQIRNAGIEDLTVLGGADGQIRFENAAYSWARNIENTQWLGEGFAVDGSFRIEIRGSYIHDGSWPEPGGAGYAISFAGGSSEVLVEDNISINACKNMVVRSCGAGSVFGYNFADDAWDYDNPAWVECGLNASHMAGPHHVLFEGNYGANFDSDYTHGNAIYITCVRNWFSGQRRDFTDEQNLRCIGATYGSWWDSFVGNVLGRAGQMGGWTYDDPAMLGNNANWSSGPDVWKLGYDPERWSMFADMATVTNAIRHGNFDYLTASQIWESSISDHAIPSSYYLSAKPAFFAGRAWPWVQPENPAQPIYSLPAMDRYNAIPLPVIITQPQSQTVHPGQTATFTAGTTFSLPLYYQWRRHGTNIQGATSATYTTPTTTTNDNSEVFDVVISNDKGSVTSSTATLTVVTPYQDWQLHYFGCTNCPQAGPNADPTGTGQNNWLKYVAGLDPTNPASRFVVTAAAITHPTPGFGLTYGPLAPGRTYRPWSCTNLAAPHWTILAAYLGPVTNAGNATLTDTNLPLPARFYRLSISYP